MIKPVLAIFASFVAAVVFVLLVFNPELVRAGIGILYRWQTLAAGSLAILAAVIGWFAIQKQIAAASDLEARRHEKDRIILAASLLAEIILARQAIQGVLNILDGVIKGTHPPPLAQDGKTDLTFTVLDSIEGTIFRANAGRIGALVDPDLANDTVIYHASITWLRKNIREQYALNPIDARLNAQLQLTKMLGSANTLIDGLSRIADLQAIHDSEGSHN